MPLRNNRDGVVTRCDYERLGTLLFLNSTLKGIGKNPAPDVTPDLLTKKHGLTNWFWKWSRMCGSTCSIAGKSLLWNSSLDLY